MTGENKGWASATLKEVPFWRDDMGPEEYEIERICLERGHISRYGCRSKAGNLSKLGEMHVL